MYISSVSFCANKKTSKAIQTSLQEDKQIKHKITPREEVGMPDGLTITTTNGNIFKNVTDEELFDLQYNSATVLSDGSRLVRPVILSLGKVDIKPTDKEKEYIVEITQFGGLNSTVKKVSEAKLLRNRTLCKGVIKEVAQDKYAITYIDRMKQKQMIAGNKKECLEFMQNNMMYM